MRFYGNDHTTIHGNIVGTEKNIFLIQFDQHPQTEMVPKHTLHKYDVTIKGKQPLEIDTWFLKKNRIIPFLSDPLKMGRPLH